MAFDIARQTLVRRNWARESSLGDWAQDQVVSQIRKKVPLIPVAIGLGAVGVGMLFFATRKNSGRVYNRHHTQPTARLPGESMRDVVDNRRR